MSELSEHPKRNSNSILHTLRYLYETPPVKGLLTLLKNLPAPLTGGGLGIETAPSSPFGTQEKEYFTLPTPVNFGGERG